MKYKKSRTLLTYFLTELFTVKWFILMNITACLLMLHYKMAWVGRGLKDHLVSTTPSWAGLPTIKSGTRSHCLGDLTISDDLSQPRTLRLQSDLRCLENPHSATHKRSAKPPSRNAWTSWVIHYVILKNGHEFYLRIHTHIYTHTHTIASISSELLPLSMKFPSFGFSGQLQRACVGSDNLTSSIIDDSAAVWYDFVCQDAPTQSKQLWNQ